MGRRIIDINHLQAYLKEFAGKKKMVEMSAELGISKPVISKYSRRLKLDMKSGELKEMQERIFEVIKKHHAKKTVREIADILEMNPMKVKYYGNILGVEFKPGFRNGGREKVERSVREGKFFNESIRENWLV